MYSSVASEYLQCQLIFQHLRKGIFIKTIIASTQREAQPRKRGMVVVEVHGATRICDGGGTWGGDVSDRCRGLLNASHRSQDHQ